MLAHMFKISRKREEAERNKRLEEMFRKADPRAEGKISREQERMPKERPARSLFFFSLRRK